MGNTTNNYVRSHLHFRPPSATWGPHASVLTSVPQLDTSLFISAHHSFPEDRKYSLSLRDLTQQEHIQ